MAMNPLLDARGYPQLFPGEIITIIYPGIYGSLHLENNLRARFKGTLYLSNARLVFVNVDMNQRQYNFALHLNLVSRERLVQSNPRSSYYEGYILPYANYMPAPGVFRFDMLQDPRPLVNGINSFLNQIRSAPGYQPAPTPGQSQALNSAYIDPEDPDIIYVVDQNKP